MEKLKQVIEQLEQEAIQLQIQGRALTPDELGRIDAINQSLPLLRQALHILSEETKTNLITYKIVSDVNGKLKQYAKTACNFWNRFIIPYSSIVLRLGVFTSEGLTIARAYKPYESTGIIYGVVEFNTKYLSQYTESQITGTIIHELGHTLGIGWDKWMNLFNLQTGEFTDAAIDQLSALKEMRVETDYGPGTQYAHWDEKLFDKELMTGIKDYTLEVLPVTIQIMSLFGHRVIEELTKKTELDTLIETLSQVVFVRQTEAKTLDLDHFEVTEVWEQIPHRNPLA